MTCAKVQVKLFSSLENGGRGEKEKQTETASNITSWNWSLGRGECLPPINRMDL